MRENRDAYNCETGGEHSGEQSVEESKSAKRGMVQAPAAVMGLPTPGANWMRREGQ
jgi:hypothetical protein